MRMLKVGSLFAERYNILEHIAAGGMADIYKAEDVDEERLVAIKVLKPELSDDKDFVRRFKIEGQATSSINCENIVHVYDVGNVGDVYYIVMELVDGVTLKQYIHRKGRLNPRETMAIAAQVAVGLRAAHAHHVIHRDIKPQNIILSRDGKAKVTDFGIAKAATDETRTLNMATMGSVHYISPEQAKGQVCDERSDIYSLGICMYEMVTGRVPFDKETSIAVALAHMNEAMVPPSELNEQCSRALEQIIFRCTQKSRERRYPNCTELLKDLKTAVANPNFDFEQQEQENLMKSNTQIFSGRDADAMKKAGKAAGAAGAAGAAMAGAKAAEAAGKTVKAAGSAAAGAGAKTAGTSAKAAGTAGAGNVSKTTGTAAADAAKAANASARVRHTDLNEQEDVDSRHVPAAREADEEEIAAAVTAGKGGSNALKGSSKKGSQTSDRRSESDRTLFDHILMIIGIVVGVACVLMAVYLIASLSGCIHRNEQPVSSSTATVIPGTTEFVEPSVETIAPEQFNPEIHTVVPNVVGMNFISAIEAFKEAELDYLVSPQEYYSDEYPIGTVIMQNYDEGTIVWKDSTIVIALSCGTDKFVIKPEYIGGPLESFKNDISRFENIYNVTYERVLSDTVQAGRIISLDPSEGILQQGASIHVVYSGGRAHVSVPDLTGLSREEAMRRLDTYGLSLGNVSTEFDHDIEEGCIISQQFAPGTTVANGSKVDVVISLGPELAKIPDVIGMLEANAITALDELGFKVEVVDYYKPVEGAEEGSSEAAETETPAGTDESGEDDATKDPEEYADVEVGQVAAVAPGVGYEYPIGDTVRIFVLREPVEANVPDVLGDTEQEAVDDLTEHGFKTITVKEKEAEDSHEIGVVIEIEPAVGTTVKLTDEIIIYIGIEKQSESETESSSAEESSSESAEGESSSAEESSSEAGETATIPDVIGDTEEEAKNALRRFKTIYVLTKVVTDPNQIGVVVEVTPGVGETIDINTVVTIYIGVEEQQPTSSGAAVIELPPTEGTGHSG